MTTSPTTSSSSRADKHYTGPVTIWGSAATIACALMYALYATTADLKESLRVIVGNQAVIQSNQAKIQDAIREAKHQPLGAATIDKAGENK